MNEWFFGLLLAYPGAFRLAGRALFSLCGVLALIGLRLDRIGNRVGRIAARAHVEAPDVLAGLPWWLRMAVPESPMGWAGLVALAVLGAYLAYLGKWASKLSE